MAALGGGLARDLLLGDTPPAALRDARYLLVPVAAAALVLLFSPLVQRLAGAVRLFDAAGLGLFVAAGTTKALDAGLGAVAAVALGCLTGVGGDRQVWAVVGAVVVVVLRVLALSRDWHAPVTPLRRRHGPVNPAGGPAS